MTDLTDESNSIRTVEPAPRKQRTRAVIAGGIGTFIEFFDYASYSYLAVTLSTVFFPTGDPAVGVIRTFAVFALSFAMRPLGGLFWGHFGDRIGRRRTLAITVIGMGVATCAIGLLPGHATVGLWAPVLLLGIRLCQSFCAAGEFCGAAILIGEYAPVARRARYVSAVPIGCATGFFLASLIVTGLQAVLSAESMTAWGWRVPFLLGAPLTLIAWYIRRSLEESPAFRELEAAGGVSVSPLLTGLRDHWRPMVRTLCVMGLNACGYYLVLSYMAPYLEQEVHLSSFRASLVVTISLLVYIPLLYVFARLADRVGRKPVLVANCVLFLVVSYPAFVLLGHSGFAAALAIQIVLVTVFCLNDSTWATYFVESFPTNVRFSGFALPFNFGVALFGGCAPLVASWLIDRTGLSTMPAVIVMAISVLCLVAVSRSGDTGPVRERR